ncbi:Lysine-specific demethylase 2B [Nymphon striatum]|nr:Lysine-specific demethylase 2B [Nymphon striatum]
MFSSRVVEISPRSKKTRPDTQHTQNKVPGYYELRFVVRPAPIIEDVEKKSGRNRHSRKYCMDKTVMLNVLKYLSVADLFHCQIVCKTWNSWCVDPVLWKKMNVSRRKLTNMHLMGIVRRQPISLDLGWTNISRKQLSWLIPRFPQIRSLSLAGCSWAAVSALCSADCPLLSSLDLNWVEGLSDSTIRDILSKPPSCTVRPGFIENKTRFRNLIEIKLAGADISDVSVRLLVQNLSLLSSFSISQCRKITDMGIAVLATAKALKLNKVDVSGCINVSDTSLESLKRCSFGDPTLIPTLSQNVCCLDGSNTYRHKLTAKERIILDELWPISNSNQSEASTCSSNSSNSSDCSRRSHRPRRGLGNYIRRKPGIHNLKRGCYILDISAPQQQYLNFPKS